MGKRSLHLERQANAGDQAADRRRRRDYTLELPRLDGRSQDLASTWRRLYRCFEASGADAFGRGRHVRTVEVGGFSRRRPQPRLSVGG